MIQSLGDIFRVADLRRRVVFTLLAVAVYRLGAAIPIPGINAEALRSLFDAQRNTLLGFLDIFSGGALGQFSIFSMGVMPYINASIIMSLLQGAHVLPSLDRLAKEGELGIDRLEGYEMSCFYDRGQGVYPEDDLSKCHGRLKEELQGIIINKLHTYVIENLGKIEEGIDKVV